MDMAWAVIYNVEHTVDVGDRVRKTVAGANHVSKFNRRTSNPQNMPRPKRENRP